MSSLLPLAFLAEYEAGFWLWPFSGLVTKIRLPLPTRVDFNHLGCLAAKHIDFGECKEQGLIHRTLIKSDYYEFQRHEDELQSSI